MAAITSRGLAGAECRGNRGSITRPPHAAPPHAAPACVSAPQSPRVHHSIGGRSRRARRASTAAAAQPGHEPGPAPRASPARESGHGLVVRAAAEQTDRSGFGANCEWQWRAGPGRTRILLVPAAAALFPAVTLRPAKPRVVSKDLPGTAGPRARPRRATPSPAAQGRV